MAVSTPQGVATASGNANSLSTASITVSGSNIVAIVAVRWSSGTISSVTWNGTGMTLVPSTSGGTGSHNTALYYLAAASTGVATANFSAMQQCSIKAYYFTGADQSTSVQNGTNVAASSGSPSQAVTSATDHQVIDVVSSPGAVTIGSGQTAIGTEIAQGGLRQNDSYEAGGTSITMSWSGINESHSHSVCDVMDASAGNQNIDGDAVFAPSLSFPTGSVNQRIPGDAVFAPTLSFPTGTVTQRIPGDAVFAPSLSFPTGSVNQRIPGDAVFAPTLSFPTGTVTQRIPGDAVFAPTLSFPTGKFTHNIVGDAVFTPTLSFPIGSVTLVGANQNIDGDAVFAPALSFPDGKFTHNIAGDAVFVPGLNFFDGTITQRLPGDAVFAPALSFPTGKFTHNVVGDAVFTPTLSFPTGQMQWTAQGDAVFAPALTFPTGAFTHNIQGDAVFTPTLSFPTGALTLDLPSMDLWLQVNLHRTW